MLGVMLNAALLRIVNCIPRIWVLRELTMMEDFRLVAPKIAETWTLRETVVKLVNIYRILKTRAVCCFHSRRLMVLTGPGDAPEL